MMYTLLFIATGTAMLATVYGLVRRASKVVSFSVVDGPFLVGEQPGPPPPIEAIEEQLQREAERQNSAMLHSLLLNSAIALTIMVIVSIVIGWLLAGRVLRPLREITSAVRDISELNLHERLALVGPADELKELGDTFDALLGRLDAAFEAQRKFIANASHELRSPLARQRAIGQVAITDPEATIESLRTAHERVLAAGQQQQGIIEALLALARGHAGVEQPRAVDLGEATREALRTRSATASALGLHVTTNLSPAVTTGDPRLVERLIANLVDNATTYNHEGGTVEVTTRTDGDRALLTVSNTGPAIPVDSVARLLEPFRRLDDDRLHHHKGQGLGLSIVKAIADAHHATLVITPRPTGGLHVELAFPASP